MYIHNIPEFWQVILFTSLKVHVNSHISCVNNNMFPLSSKNQLSSTEITTIKQLIAGYRESAAFLYRSADELEQLLLQQN